MVVQGYWRRQNFMNLIAMALMTSAKIRGRVTRFAQVVPLDPCCVVGFAVALRDPSGDVGAHKAHCMSKPQLQAYLRQPVAEPVRYLSGKEATRAPSPSRQNFQPCALAKT